MIVPFRCVRKNRGKPGSPTIQAKFGERYRVTLKAHAPQGVQSIKINPSVGSGEIMWTCNLPGQSIALNKSAMLGPMTQTLAPDTNNYVLKSIFLVDNLDFTLGCQSGWNFASGTAQLTGRASNYYGGITTEVIKFAIIP